MTSANPPAMCPPVTDADLLALAQNRGLALLPRSEVPPTVATVAGPVRVRTVHGPVDAFVFQFPGESAEHLVLTRGIASGPETAGPVPAVLVHNECVAGDVFRSGLCDCRRKLTESLATLAGVDSGALIYLRSTANTSLSHRAHLTYRILVRLGLPLVSFDGVDAAAGGILPSPAVIEPHVRARMCRTPHLL
ncbi:GTP cyclohydrolase II [Micromonospora pallida]|uniref:GTP cyclohydrolase II n=1 Tax=Micromonospora pallida TaxID=145854 RepID=A0A1C6SFH1_9ACTN|nr:hypothetical protein [Micromonospora pallida]SCL28153.1 GTP cyclohydrolase II [Micromonospora pallida]